MPILYSPSLHGFFDTDIHAPDRIPADAYEVTEEIADELRVRRPEPPTGNAAVQAQIRQLETQQTPRRLREAALGADGGWLAALDMQIASLRASLT